MPPTPFILPLEKITKKSIAQAGGKGASLGEMTAAGIPIPPGFVVSALAFDRFLEETDLFQAIQAELDNIHYDDVNSVDRYSNVIRDMIAKTAFPLDLIDIIMPAFRKLKSTYVAVRSSATAEDSHTASWAGELETFLNTTEKTIIKNIQKCWSSLFTPRAIFYRHEKKLLDSNVSVAVVVQTMIQSETSGITFTVHPVTKDPNQMIIEAGWGLGEAIVSGQITPDAYVIEKDSLTIIDTNIGIQEKMLVQKSTAGEIEWVPVAKTKTEKQKLSEKKITELTTLCNTIEKHYGFPCDIEWAEAKGKFYITQSRPITTLV